MSKKQTRRSISVSGECYDRLQAYVRANGQTGSGFIEGLVRGFFEMPDRDQKEVIAPIPRFERKSAANGFRDTPPPAPRRPAQVGDPLVGGPRVHEVVLTAPVLKEKTDWVERNPMAGPVDRVQVIRDAAEAKVVFARRDESEVKKEGAPLEDMASKIFTF